MERGQEQDNGRATPQPQQQSLVVNVLRFIMILYAMHIFMTVGSKEAKKNNHQFERNNEDSDETLARKPFVDNVKSMQYSSSKTVHACHWQPGSVSKVYM